MLGSFYFYNPNKANAPAFVQDVTDILSEINLHDRELVLLGDSNIDCLTNEIGVFDPLVDGFDFQQIVDVPPTHMVHANDNIFKTSRPIIVASEIGAPIEPHHCFTWVQLNRCSTKTLIQEYTVRDWDGADWPKAQVFLVTSPDGTNRDFRAEVLDPMKSVDEAANHLNSELLRAQFEAVREHTKAVRMRRPICSWMNKPTFRQIQ
ncbi:MAG: hypothetical protein GY696_19645 [Gammaproteobacteria bacterium]|nr:hypothetical protein [Gammaproteobacteria bacterium]